MRKCEYRKCQIKYPWIPLNLAVRELGLTRDGFLELVMRERLDIPKRYADEVDGEMMISPLAMITLFLLRGMPEKAMSLVALAKMTS